MVVLQGLPEFLHIEWSAFETRVILDSRLLGASILVGLGDISECGIGNLGFKLYVFSKQFLYEQRPVKINLVEVFDVFVETW